MPKIEKTENKTYLKVAKSCKMTIADRIKMVNKVVRRRKNFDTIIQVFKNNRYKKKENAKKKLE